MASTTNDDRLTEVREAEKEALTENDRTYDNMVNSSDKYYDAQIQASKDWAKKQTELQNEQTDFTIEQINQQKDQAQKDYTKEQSGAYVDWQKQSNQYGANAEQMAANGLTNTGFSESSQVSMYNAYQNRVAKARESFTRAVLNYGNAIKDARLQNSSVLAEIAYKALQEQLELSLQGFQYKNQLIIQKADKKTSLKNDYWQRYQGVLQQINTENALAEQKRQHNNTLALQREQFEWQKAQAAAKSSSSSSGGGIEKSSSSKSSGSGSSSVNKSSSSSKPPIFTDATYKGAVAYIEKYGDKNQVDGLMTDIEWTARRNTYLKSGIGNEAVRMHNSYASYLTNYVYFATTNK